MSVLTVRAKLKEEHVADAEAAVKRMLAAIERERLEGIRYASVKLEDGVTFLALLEVEDGVENPLPGLPEAQEFYDSLPGWYAEPPDVRTGNGGRVLPALIRRRHGRMRCESPNSCRGSRARPRRHVSARWCPRRRSP
jgi:hypothetical protein